MTLKSPKIHGGKGGRTKLRVKRSKQKGVSFLFAGVIVFRDLQEFLEDEHRKSVESPG